MPQSSFLDNLLVFGRILRSRGLEVHMGRLLDVTEALQHIDLSRRDDVYETCRTLLVHRHEDFPIFEQAFAEFFAKTPAPDGRPVSPSSLTSASRNLLESVGGLELNEPASAASPASPALKTWSDVETIATKDFASLTDDELVIARTAVANLAWNPGQRRTRRWVRGRGPRIDLRRALAASLRTGGEITTLPRRRRRSRPRPLVMLCDVSGSMERYSRTLLHFTHALSRKSRRVETFLFATRLTRITMELRTRRPDTAIAGASRAVHDWSGGTRIGAVLRDFHQRWRRRTLHGGPVVLLISDGWDRGDPQVLREEIARLQRSCHRLIWLNPLIGTPEFAPLTRGLQAALPFVDDFLPVRTLRDVRDLAIHLGSLEGRK